MKEDEELTIEENEELQQLEEELKASMAELDGSSKEETTDTNEEESNGRDGGEDAKLSEILQSIRELHECFTEKIEKDEHKDALFNDMHRELVQYHNGALDRIADSISLDIIQLSDNIRKSIEACEQEDSSEGSYEKLLRMLKGVVEDLQDILYRQSVEPYSVPGDDVDAKKQKITAMTQTDIRELDNKVSLRVKEGYERNGTVIRPEWVHVYKYTPNMEDQGDLPDNNDTQSNSH